jgi:hypothetical protein
MSGPPVIRGCDGCTMCCKVMRVPELPKEINLWCPHVARGKGCGIYETRPGSCREFQCLYTTEPTLTEAWKPAECKFVIRHEAGGGGRIAIHVDTQRPDAWRREPFLSTFHRWAELAMAQQGQVVVHVGRHAYVVVPDRVVDIGEVGPDDLILTKMTKLPDGRVRLDPFKASRNDPEFRAFAPQGDGQ